MIHNLQGDVVGLFDSTGTEVVRYTYDAWGKPLSKTGSLAGTLRTLNPFRYRGYVFDEETGLCYLRSRYYCAEWCGFINADKEFGENLFCYSDNSPNNKADPDGNDAIWLQEAHSAFSQGHSGLVVQSNEHKWYFFFWGPQIESFNFGLLFGGVDLGSYNIGLTTEGYDMRNISDLKAAIRGSTHPERADLITDIGIEVCVLMIV